MSMMVLFKGGYTDGRTKQSFKDATDINKLLVKAARGDSISHLAKHGAVYGDFSDVDDLLSAQARLATGKAIFMELPGEVRREFENSAGKFFNFVNNPANVNDLARLIPGLAERGNQMPVVSRTSETAPVANVVVPDVVVPTPVAPVVLSDGVTQPVDNK